MPWSMSSIPDLSSKTILITGATSGIGLECARTLVEHKARVILACRNPTKMSKLANSLTEEFPTATILQLQLDVADLDSVRLMRDKLREASIDNIDVLLLNAGISTPDTFVPSAQGYELVFATNHLGHFLLTHLVMPYMKHVSGSRVIVVSSLMHRFVHRINYKAAAGDQEEFSTRAYAESKLANHWFVAELNRRLQQAKVETVAVCAHPGVASTGILQVSSGLWVPWIVGHVFRLISQSAMKGAWPLLMAVGDEDMKRGEYYVPGGMWELWGLPKKGGILNPVVSRVDKAAELWEVSERLSGVSFRI